ncbi:MAG: glycosyltransferase family 4 protein, partial [Muribaculum sp.]|nr:glycosyltransferase family 4 protein [Muribaculum sp.]
FVWGPVGAMKDGVSGYYNDFSLLMRMKSRLKYIINKWQIRHYPLSNKAMRKASLVLAATSEVRDFIRRWHRDDVVLMNETGCYALPEGLPAERDDQCMSMIWVGKFDPRKQLQIAIRTLACLRNKHDNVCLHIVGAGTPDQQHRARQLADKLGCSGSIIWHGKVPNTQVHNLMRQSSVLLFTSIDEGTPHVVLEAVQNHLPVICFDTCGQRDIVTEDTGVKIPLTNPDDSVRRFTRAISQLIDNPAILRQKRRNCSNCQPELLWDEKARRMVALYEQCLEKEQCDNMPHHN